MKPKIDRVGTVLIAHDFSKDQSEVWIPGWEFSHPTKAGMSVSFHRSTPNTANLVITGNGPGDTCKDLTDRLKMSVLDTGFHLHTDGSGGEGYLLKELETISLQSGIGVIANPNIGILSTGPFNHVSPSLPSPGMPLPPTDPPSNGDPVGSKTTLRPRRKFGWPPTT